MSLRTFVKVSSISNLSDARYCAGMGVDLLGFCTIEGQDGYINPVRFQEIRGWVTGPKIVAEVYGLKNATQIESILEDYKPDYLEMGLQEWSVITTSPIPVILSVEHAEQLRSLSVSPAYLIGDKSIDTKIPFLIRVNSPTDIELILQEPNINGIVLKGGAELKPGLKDTEMINDVLELLETDD
jgi:phosphoribosylanthranilate isomerase